MSAKWDDNLTATSEPDWKEIARRSFEESVQRNRAGFAPLGPFRTKLLSLLNENYFELTGGIDADNARSSTLVDARKIIDEWEQLEPLPFTNYDPNLET